MKTRASVAFELLVSHGWDGDVLVDVGKADPFLEAQLKPELLQSAAQTADVGLEMRLQAGYDHSYYFVTSFIEDYIAWHKSRLTA